MNVDKIVAFMRAIGYDPLPQQIAAMERMQWRLDRPARTTRLSRMRAQYRRKQRGWR